MLRKILSLAASRMVPGNENTPTETPEGMVSPRNVRALATGAALAVSLDTTPAVVVSIYEYAHRFRDKPRRSA
jgi:hypothetical protein